MRQANNQVKIVGLLAESDIKYISYTKNGMDTEAIGGSVKILVEQKINGEQQTLVIPVNLFASKYTQTGAVSKSYVSIEKVMKEFVSIAAAGDKDKADKVSVGLARLKNNPFIGQNGEVICPTRVEAGFINKVVGDFKPEATFTLEFVVSNLHRAVDKNGIELDPPRLEVDVVVPQFTKEGAEPNVDVMKLIATNPNVISAAEDYWETGYTYTANGRLNFTSTTEEVTTPVDFGEPKTEMRTITVHDLVVTGGSQTPMDDGIGFAVEDIKRGLAARKIRLEDMKNRKTTDAKRAPAQSSAKAARDLGF